MLENAICIKNVSKSFDLHSIQGWKPNVPKKKLVLSNVSLSVQKGKTVGLLGPNGSGKTTLLKIIAKITPPTEGEVTVVGRVTSVIELTAGFELNLPAHDNILLSGTLLGIEPSLICDQENQIIDFAGIGAYRHLPLRTYSQGMLLRLGMSIALFSMPEILLIDEFFLVGDDIFREQTLYMLQNVLASATVIMASQYPDFIDHYVDDMFLVDDGKVTNFRSFSHINQFFTSLKLGQSMRIVVKSASMMPLIVPQQEIEIQKIPFTELVKGDIIGYIIPRRQTLIVHRVIDIFVDLDGKRVVRTKGDNSPIQDIDSIREDQYVGIFRP